MWFALQSHTGEVFVLEAHPTDPRILMSAGALCSGGCFSQKESIVTVCVCVCLLQGTMVWSYSGTFWQDRN